MASLNHCMIILATIFFFFFFLHSFSPIAATGSKIQSHLLQKACNKATIHDHKLCMKLLESNPQTASASTPLALANAVLRMAMFNTIKARQRIRVLLMTNKYAQPAYISAMEDCIYWYDVAAGDFNVSSRELHEDPPTANYDAMLAGSQTQNCENALVSGRVQVPEIASLNQKLVLFGTIAGAVIDILELSQSPQLPPS